MKCSRRDIAALVVMALWLIIGSAVIHRVIQAMPDESALVFIPFALIVLFSTVPFVGLSCYPYKTPMELYLQKCSVATFTGKPQERKEKGGKA